MNPSPMPRPMPPPSVDRHFFIIGCARSGTTLLQRMLEAHPLVGVTPETHFMQRFWRRRPQYGLLSTDEDFRRLVEDIIAMPEFAEMQLDSHRFRERAWAGAREVAALFRLLLEEFAGVRKVSIVGEKTPDHLHDALTLARFFPGARFLHIVRDPRAVVNSWQGVPWTRGSITRDALAWRRKLAAMRHVARRLGPALHTVRYEALVRAPEENLRAICRFLDIAFEPGMLEYHRASPRTFVVEREPWKRNALRPIDPAAPDRWRETLSPERIAEIEAAVLFEMRRWGYRPESKGLLLKAMSCTLADTLRQTLERAHFHLWSRNGIVGRRISSTASKGPRP